MLIKKVIKKLKLFPKEIICQFSSKSLAPSKNVYIHVKDIKILLKKKKQKAKI